METNAIEQLKSCLEVMQKGAEVLTLVLESPDDVRVSEIKNEYPDYLQLMVKDSEDIKEQLAYWFAKFYESKAEMAELQMQLRDLEIEKYRLFVEMVSKNVYDEQIKMYAKRLLEKK